MWCECVEHVKEQKKNNNNTKYKINEIVRNEGFHYIRNRLMTESTQYTEQM